MAIFDDAERTLLGGASHLISAFDYLNTSARPEAAQVRAKLEGYLASYPEAHRNNLRSRIRSLQDRQHHAATFEILLHAVLIAAGCVIEEIEPPVPASNHRPDFLVRSAAGHRFYLEAIVPSCVSVAEAGAERRMDEALHAIDQVDSPNFYLSLFTDGLPTQPVALAALRQAVQAWVNALDYDTVKAAWDAKGALPSFEQAHHGARIRIEPVPRMKTRGALGERAIGARMGGVQLVEDYISIRNAVIKKANRYGALDLPYVVAVNAMGQFSDEDHADFALFGTEAVVFNRNVHGELNHRFQRNPDGVWYGPHGPRKTGVSAVLSVERLTGWSLSQRRARFFLNPWAARPLTVPCALDIRRVENDRLIKQKSQSVREILGIAENWPEE